MADNTRTQDELVLIADQLCETAITTLAAFNGVSRVGALRLLTTRMLRKNTTNKTRVRTAATN